MPNWLAKPSAALFAPRPTFQKAVAFCGAAFLIYEKQVFIR
jgi:hypothetical protein